MSGAGRAFVALDRGTATLAVALVGRIAGRWRLLASLAVPAGVESEAAVALLGLTVERTDPDLAAELHLDGGAALALPRLVAETTPTPTLAVVGVTERALGPLGAVAERAGWRTWRASMERLDPLAMLRFLLDERVEAILAGAGDPAGADERPGLAELAAVVAAAGERRPDLPIVLAGGLAAVAERLSLFAGRRPMVPTGSGTPVPEPATTGATVAAEGAEPDATPEAGAEPPDAGAEPPEASAEPSEVSAGSSASETSGATDAPGTVADREGS
ncbi:MAG TPA: hypothetical protein VNO86_05930, partial [Candidatus Binatia bacterium]|nr:hypothetical protein [Candidatus Binatia bacterium]